MNNPETLATLDTQDTGQRKNTTHTTPKTKKMSYTYSTKIQPMNFQDQITTKVSSLWDYRRSTRSLFC